MKMLKEHKTAFVLAHYYWTARAVSPVCLLPLAGTTSHLAVQADCLQMTAVDDA